jgi:filamentous hemagglutinin
MDSDAAVLGRFEPGSPNSYEAVAQSQGAAYFELGTEDGVDLWNAVEEANHFGGSDMFDAANAPFLDDIMMDGKTIIFSHDPLSARPGSYLEMEYQYIFENGPFAGTYRWDPTVGPHGAAVPI